MGKSPMDGPRIERDCSDQILKLDAPPTVVDHEPPPLVGSLNQLSLLGGGRGFVSACMLLQKAKQFDDGLYAAVELAALHGHGNRRARTTWLAELRQALGESSASTGLHAAARMLNPDCVVPGPLVAAVAKRIAGFMADKIASKPISFYTWTEELSALFRHDRALQATVPGDELSRLIATLHANGDIRRDYESYLGLIERLTNPLAEAYVRAALQDLDDDREASIREAALLPASASCETDLIKKLYGNSPIPDGFELMTELVSRVRSGSIDLRPTSASGWYDHQIWALEALLQPEGTPEAARLQFSSEYREHLEELAKTAWALGRETHAKQLEFSLCGAAMSVPPPKPKLYVQPELSCEPLVTHYRRRADSYRFVRRVITEYFGADALQAMHRQTADGSVDASLEHELTFITDLFDGAAAMSERQLGVNTEVPGRVDEVYRNWNAVIDPDLGADVRMMVPVFYDVARKQTKVWVVLGWSHRDISVSFVQPPSIVARDNAGKDVTADYDVVFIGDTHSTACPEFAEIYVDRILDRDEFRSLCDQHGSAENILAALQGLVVKESPPLPEPLA